ncbi:MAG: IS110 family transposase [Bacteroides sp.]|nr:IS110 family transposase [Bacteroides sp.]
MKNLSTIQHFVGCDVSKDTLDFAIFEHGKDYRMFEHIQVDNSQEGFQQLRKWLRTFKINLKDTVIAMEHTGFYSSALSEWCFKKGIPFVMLHPMDVKMACTRGRNKTDSTDAKFIADYVYTMREKLDLSAPEPAGIRLLRELRNERRMAVRARTAYLNQLKTVKDKETQRRIKKVIDSFTEQIKDIESAIKKEIENDPEMSKNYHLLISIPGIGLVNAMTTIVATGNFTRFRNARQYAKFACVSPLSRESGTSIRGGNHVTRIGHIDIKSTLTEGARSAMTHDPQIKAYYERKRSQGKSYGCIMNAIKFKLICRMFAVVKRNTPYVNTEAFRS